MRKHILILLVFLCFACNSQTHTEITNFDQFETFITKKIREKEIPSVAVAVIKNGMIVYEKAFGFSDVENKIQATIHTPYQLASASKPITATGLMILHEKELIDIDEPVTLYMGDLALKKANDNYKTPTVRQVLNHTAGLDTYFKLQFSDEITLKDDFITAFEKYGVLFHNSGEKFEYSNLGYGLTGHIISEITKLPFHEFIKKEVFLPLDMNHSFIDIAGKLPANAAVKYSNTIKSLPHIYNNTQGAGNVYSSVHDLIKFGNFYLQDTQENILSTANKKQMQEYKDEKALYHYYQDTTYGLGWYRRKNDNGYDVIWHEGGMTGASSMLKLIPKEDIAIAVITNTYNNTFCRKVTDILSGIVLPDYTPSIINELANYTNETKDDAFFGVWEGNLTIGGTLTPCSLSITKKGGTFKYNNGTKEKKIKLKPVYYKNAMLDSFRGAVQSEDISSELAHVSVLKLIKIKDKLSGSLSVIDITERQRQALPFYIELKKK